MAHPEVGNFGNVEQLWSVWSEAVLRMLARTFISGTQAACGVGPTKREPVPPWLPVLDGMRSVGTPLRGGCGVVFLCSKDAIAAKIIACE